LVLRIKVWSLRFVFEGCLPSVSLRAAQVRYVTRNTGMVLLF